MFENKNQNNTDEQLNNIEEQLAEIELLRQSVDEHKKSLKSFWKSFLVTGFIMIAAMIALLFGAMAWFVSNSQVRGTSAMISAAGKQDFALATVGTKEQGVYDSEFGLSSYLTLENIGGTDYYIASGNGSLRVGSNKNMNNYLANADLRPGNRGSFDIYLIRRNTNADNLRLEPVLTPYLEDKTPIVPPLEGETPTEVQNIAEFLKGHFLLFANVDDKGMYSGNINFSQPLEIVFLNDSQVSVTQGGRTFAWGNREYADNETEVYHFPVYWVWPDQFGNFIYTGNAYNKNLFVDDMVDDYRYFYNKMQDPNDYKIFFSVAEGVSRPSFDDILQSTNYHQATQYYDLYTSWYNLADEKIGENIRYFELGFEISSETSQGGEIE